MYTTKLDQIQPEIFQVILSNHNWHNQLSIVAEKIGELFSVEACGIFANDRPTVNQSQIAWWQREKFSPTEQEQLLQQFQQLLLAAKANNRSNASENNSDSDRQQDLIQGKKISQITLPTKNLLTTVTRFRQHPNGAIVLLK